MNPYTTHSGARRTVQSLALRTLSTLALVSSLAVTTFGAPAPRAAHANNGTWLQTDWTTQSTTIAVRPSGTGEFVIPTYGLCLTSSGAACQGPGDTAPGQTLRLNPSPISGQLPDLNGDGPPEVIFAQYVNNPSKGIRLYWGQPGGAYGVQYDTSASSDLPTLKPTHIAASDLNGDGWFELVSAQWTDPNYSYIWWGQPGGTYGVEYTIFARTPLTAAYAYDAAITDLNRDGRSDIVLSTFYGQNRIYWGQPGGTYGTQYSASASTTLVTGRQSSVAIGDLNGDGQPEIVFAATDSNNSSIYIYWGQPGGAYGVQYSDSARTDLPASYAQGVAVGDLNGDEQLEIVFADFSSSGGSIYWAQPGGTYGVHYSTSARTDLAISYARDVAIGDLNVDGRPEVVFAISGSSSSIYWAQPGGAYGVQYSDSARDDLPTSSAYDVAVGDLNGDRWPEIVFSNYAPGSNSFIYWGQPGGTYGVQYSIGARTDLPTVGAWGIGRTGGGAGSVALLGRLDSQVMDSGQDNAAWAQVTATTQIPSPSTGITLFVAASNYLTALITPTWTLVGAIGNGNWSQALTNVTGRYARYRVQLWRSSPTATSPALQSIAFTYVTTPPTQHGFVKSSPANGAANQPPHNLALSWSQPADATRYEVCFDTNVNGACNGAWQNVGNVPSTTVSGLLPSTAHEWQVRACNAFGCNDGADDGQWWTFTTAADGWAMLDNPATRKEVTPTTVAMGGVLTYTIVVSNSGLYPVAATVTDTLPVSATLLSAAPGFTQTGQTLVWNFALNPGATQVLTLAVRAGSGDPMLGYSLNNMAEVGAHDGHIQRTAPAVTVTPYRLLLLLVYR